MALSSAVRRLALNAFTAVNRHLFSPDMSSSWELQLVGGAALPNYNNNINEKDTVSVFDEAILRMAVPKSKVSPSRKRMKWQQHIPDRVEWSVCVKCGEPRRPHRICTAHMDICAMRDDEWKAHKARTDVEDKQ